MRGLGVVVVLVVVLVAVLVVVLVAVLMVLVIGSWEVTVEASVVVILKKKLKNEKVVPAESTSLLAAIAALYVTMSVCRLVGPSVRPSVGWSVANEFFSSK